MTDDVARKVLARHGKSFYWASFFLGDECTDNAAQLYQFCRFVDDLADGDAADKESRLKLVQDCLKGAENACEIEVMEFMQLALANDIPMAAASELVGGMLADQMPARFTDTRELLRYCHAVAGTVGLMMCRILNCRQARAESFAIDLGVAMQLTNIARDVLEDANMGRRYIPSEWLDLSDTQLSPENWSDASPEMRVEIASATRKLLELAETYYASAMIGIHLLPFKARLSIAIALRVYRHIGYQLQARNYAWWRGRVMVSILHKVGLSVLGAAALLPRRVPPHCTELHHPLRGLAGVDSD